MLNPMAFLRDYEKKNPTKQIINSFVFGILCFLYLINVGSFLQPIVFPLIDRVTYSTQFANIFFINAETDYVLIMLCTVLWLYVSIKSTKKYVIVSIYGFLSLVVLALRMEIFQNFLMLSSIPLIISVILIGYFRYPKSFQFNKNLSITYISLIGIGLGLLSAIISVYALLFPDVELPPINYMYYSILILSIFSPMLIILVSFSFVLVRISAFFKNKFSIQQINETKEFQLVPSNPKLSIRIIHLSFLILFSIGISIIPHLGIFNFDSQIIGSDTNDYAKIMHSLSNSADFAAFLNQVFVNQLGGDRPLSLIFLFFFSQSFNTNNYSVVLDNLPTLLSPLLIITIYFLTLELTRNHYTSAVASLLTIPFHILIGIYGGLYSNWLALIFAYLSILFLFRFLITASLRNLIYFSTLQIVLVLSHTPSWTIFLYVIIISVSIFYFKKSFSSKLISFTIFGLIPSILIDFIRMLTVKSSGILQEMSFAQTKMVGIHDINVIWSNLIDTTHLYMAGLIGNPIILLLVFYWICNCTFKQKYTVFFIVFFSLSILPILFAEQEIQTRYLFEIPFQIPAALSLIWIYRKYGHLIVIMVCLWISVYSLRTVSNFIFVGK